MRLQDRDLSRSCIQKKLLMRLIFFLTVLSLFCCKNTRKTNSLSFTSEELNYFNEIAFYSEITEKENKPITRWEEDVVFKIVGNTSQENLELIDSVLNEINSIGLPISIKLSDTHYNSKLFIGNPYLYFKETNIRLSKNSLGRVNVNYKRFINEGEIHKAMVFINEELTIDQKKSVLLEELIQSLGLTGDSASRAKSLFYEIPKIITSVPPIDKQLLRLLYSEEVTTGMDSGDFREKFQKKLISENTEEKILNYCKKKNFHPSLLHDILDYSSPKKNVITKFPDDIIYLSFSNSNYIPKRIDDYLHQINRSSPNINLVLEEKLNNNGIQVNFINDTSIVGHKIKRYIYNKTNVLNQRRYLGKIDVILNPQHLNEEELSIALFHNIIKIISVFDDSRKISDANLKHYIELLSFYYSDLLPSGYPIEKFRKVVKNYDQYYTKLIVNEQDLINKNIK